MIANDVMKGTDEVLIKLADYALSDLKLTNEVLSTARYCIIDAIGMPLK